MLCDTVLCLFRLLHYLYHLVHVYRFNTPSPTLQPQQHECVRALSTCLIDNCPVVVTGGTDRTVRLWNLVDPALCSCVISPRLHSKKIHFDYK